MNKQQNAELEAFKRKLGDQDDRAEREGWGPGHFSIEGTPPPLGSKATILPFKRDQS